MREEGVNIRFVVGWNRYSIGYFSNNGCKYFSSPFNGKPYGMTFRHGDVIGVGYRHRTGTIFFTRNGRKLEDAYTGLRWNLFPTIGANGPCQIHVNLGQMGFVFVEANVKKWGLAPSQGTLAPPPAYGFERDTILLATGHSSSAQDEQGPSSSSVSSSSRNHSQPQPEHPVLITMDDGVGQAPSGFQLMPNVSPPPYSSPQPSGNRSVGEHSSDQPDRSNNA